MLRAADLSTAQVRQALHALDIEPPAQRTAGVRALRQAFAAYGTVKGLVDDAPDDARAAFVDLAHHGPRTVEELLGRGWWGHGTLPPPLDWLQQRGLVAAGDDGLVHAVAEARAAFAEQALPLPEVAPTSAPETAGASEEGVRVEEAGCVLVAGQPAALDRALTVTDAELRAVAPTVAVSPKPATDVGAALRAAGVRLTDDTLVAANPGEPALPDAAEEAIGPRAVRALLGRAVAEKRQVWLHYFASSRGGAATERVVDPWAFAEDLLRGHCHLRRGERTFAVDRIGRARLLPSGLEHPAPTQ